MKSWKDLSAEKAAKMGIELGEAHFAVLGLIRKEGGSGWSLRELTGAMDRRPAEFPRADSGYLAELFGEVSAGQICEMALLDRPIPPAHRPAA